MAVYTVFFSRLPLHRFVQERLTLRFAALLLFVVLLHGKTAPTSREMLSRSDHAKGSRNNARNSLH